MAKITIDAFYRITATALPMAARMGFAVDNIGDGSVRVRMRHNDDWVRPGGTVAGPALMALADYAMYAAVMGALGPTPLAVTSNLNINFLRKPAPVDVIANCQALRIGRRQAVFEITLHSDGEPNPIAHVTGTYALPGLARAEGA
jgi:uncharacterized protein (TIGR00369 family)